MLTYNFEKTLIPSTLAGCRKNDLAVVDTEGVESFVRQAVERGVWVYGYLNIGALEDGRRITKGGDRMHGSPAQSPKAA